MGDREIYPNAPVVLVACEIRYPTADPLTRAQQRDFKAALAHRFPLMRSVTRERVTVVNGGPPEVTQETVPRFETRDRTSAVTPGPDALVVETTEYERYEVFRESLETALQTLADLNPPDGVERVGLRYIDEIRVPRPVSEWSDWCNWVNPSLVGPAENGAPLGLLALDWQGLMRFTSGSSNMVVLRYGPREGYAVDPSGPLRRAGGVPEPSPYFLLDIDSFSEATDEVPAYEVAELLNTVDELHAPVRELFESVITEDLRREVLRQHA